MTLTPNVIFDLDPRHEEEPSSWMDVVNFAIAPIDVLTGRIVSKNISASVSAEVGAGQFLTLPDKPIRNLSGLLVFVNLQKPPPYQVQLNAQNSKYFDPDPVVFPPVNPGSDFDENRNPRLDVPLYPRPGFSFNEFVTLISGVVKRDAKDVQGAKVSVIVPEINLGVVDPDSSTVFETKTNELGAFVLPMNLFRDIDLDDEQVEVVFKIESKDANEQWQVEFELTELKIFLNQRSIFNKPIDLANQDANKDIKLLIGGVK